MDANPQVRHALSDPAVLRQSLEMIEMMRNRNPDAMREAMRHQDIALRQLENHPERFNAMRRPELSNRCWVYDWVCLGRMVGEMQEPMMEARMEAARAAMARHRNHSSRTGTNRSGEVFIIVC